MVKVDLRKGRDKRHGERMDLSSLHDLSGGEQRQAQ